MRHFFLFLAVLVLSGCGGGGGTNVSLEGKLVPPAGMTIAPTDNIEVQFLPIDEKNIKGGASKVFEGKDAGFTVEKIKAGKYKVIVKITPYQGMPESEARTRALEPINTANDMHQTKMTYEVGTEAKQSITVDLSKSAVTKN